MKLKTKIIILILIWKNKQIIMIELNQIKRKIITIELNLLSLEEM